MQEQVAQELLAALGSGSASLQTAINLVHEFGADRVRGFIAELAEEGPRAEQVKAGLLVSLLCCSDKLADVLKANGIVTEKRTILRAVKQSRELPAALKRLIAGRGEDEDMPMVWAAIAQAGSASVPTTPEEAASRTMPLRAARSDRPVSEPMAQEMREPRGKPEVSEPRDASSGGQRPMSGPVVATASEEQGAASTPIKGQGLHIYGGKGALAMEPCTSRAGELALTVDAAAASGVRQYDWRNKIIVQLTHKEMLLLFAVLRGFLASFEATAHGAANDKSFSIENQASKFYVKVIQKGRPMIALPIEPADAVRVVLMLGAAIVKNTPLLGDLAGVDSLVKPMTEMLLAPQPRRAA